MRYTEALFGRRGDVAGYRLLPLSFGHAFLLERVGCPLMPDGERRDLSAGDVATLIWVCSRPWADSLRGFGRWGARKRVEWIAGRITPYLTEAILSARHYVARQFEGPRVDVVSDQREMESPTLATLKVFLMAELGVPELDVMDRLVSSAAWDIAIQGERHGVVEVIGRQTHEALRLAAEARNRLLVSQRNPLVVAETDGAGEGDDRG